MSPNYMHHNVRRDETEQARSTNRCGVQVMLALGTWNRKAKSSRIALATQDPARGHDVRNDL